MAIYPVVDADSHVEEPEEAWEYLDKEYEARKPFALVTEDRPILGHMNAFWYIDGQVVPKPYGHGATVYGTPLAQNLAKGKTFSIGSQALTDADARLRDMDSLGVDISVIFPTVFLEPLTDDIHFEAALMRSYNTWMTKACAKRPDRLKWAAVMPMRDLPAAIEELRRGRDLGAVTAGIYGTVDHRMLHHPDFEPFFAEAERLAMPVCVHVGWSHPGLKWSMDTTFGAHAVSFALPVMMGFYSFVGGNILNKFPRLKVAFLEAGAGWLPYLVDRLDHYFHADTALDWWVPERLPSDCVRDSQIYVTCEAEERLLPQVIETLGEDRVLMEADLPHSEARHSAVREIQERKDISDAVKEKILSKNALRFFNL
ncbi:MAG: amidohydrolase family protein [Deltaproteobacteria bacterium]|nr:amidohydrolase family protein [Deltaproteobacteria bacterium]